METNSSSDSITETVEAESARRLRPHGLLIGFKESRRRRGEQTNTNHVRSENSWFAPAKLQPRRFSGSLKKAVSNNSRLMKDALWSLFGMVLVAAETGRGCFSDSSSHPCHLLTLWEKGKIDAPAVNSAAGNRSHLFLTSSLPPTSLPPAYELW